MGGIGRKQAWPLALAAVIAGCGGADETTPAAAAPVAQTASQGNGCNDFALHDTEGTRYVVESTGVRTGVDSSMPYASKLEVTVGGLMTFEGREVRDTTFASTADSGMSHSIWHSYTRRTGESETTTYGGESRTWSTGQSLSVDRKDVYAQPVVDKKFSLNVGETVSVPSVNVIMTPAQTYSATIGGYATTYAGRETVTVPAGTFLTCRFETVIPYPNGFPAPEGPAKDTVWVITGYGIIVKSTSTGFLFGSRGQATSVTVNGTRL